MSHNFTKVIFSILTVLILNSCYIPDKFKAEIQLSKNGAYIFSYYGDLIWAPLFRNIQRHLIDEQKVSEEIKVIQRDLSHDSHFKSVESAGEGRFHVEYHYQDIFRPSDFYAFVRRNAPILQMRADKNGRLIIVGRAMKSNQAAEATSLGLSITGEFRIITDGNVIMNNATKVIQQGPYRVYIWNITNIFSPSLKFVMQREGNWSS
jgi:hypothetical protein